MREQPEGKQQYLVIAHGLGMLAVQNTDDVCSLVTCLRESHRHTNKLALSAQTRRHNQEEKRHHRVESRVGHLSELPVLGVDQLLAPRRIWRGCVFLSSPSSPRLHLVDQEPMEWLHQELFIVPENVPMPSNHELARF